MLKVWQFIRLQTSLEFEHLLDLFFHEIQQSVLVDGMSYQPPKVNLTISTGKQSRHKIRYQLQTQDDDMGELVFYRSTRFREQELANLEGLLSTLVYPLRNALHYHSALQASFQDPLTGVGNRAALNHTLEREMELAKRHQQSLAVLMLDIDYFKRINDTYGHCMGDKALKEVANSILHCIRQTDVCFRYGGEEFLVLLNNTSIKGAWVISERIRQYVEQLRFVSDGQSFQVSISVGYTNMQPQDTRDSLIHRADTALYQAKNQGRNQVIGG